jgi:hypothetical protein
MLRIVKQHWCNSLHHASYIMRNAMSTRHAKNMMWYTSHDESCETHWHVRRRATWLFYQINTNQSFDERERCVYSTSRMIFANYMLFENYILMITHYFDLLRVERMKYDVHRVAIIKMILQNNDTKWCDSNDDEIKCKRRNEKRRCKRQNNRSHERYDDVQNDARKCQHASQCTFRSFAMCASQRQKWSREMSRTNAIKCNDVRIRRNEKWIVIDLLHDVFANT